eukprot:TRINITY_DN13682_c0_g1_i4.p1 TRINITY_DN13682_c0_g1~~TRINITY_DN13682_c0_g1_i4.p1  ORF type:complete len:638 (-),score=94.47 TRINITY_DN13682_c0_g1_i4:151-2013(-)
MVAIDVRFVSVICGGIVLVVHLALQLRCAVAKLCEGRGRWCGEATHTLSRIRVVADMAMGLGVSKVADEEDLFHKAVEQALTNRREELLRVMLPHLSNACSLCCVGIMYNSSTTTLRWMSLEQDVIFLCIFVVFVIGQRSSCKTRPSCSLFMINSLMFLFLMMTVCAMPIKSVYSFSSAVLMGPRLLVSATLLRGPPIILWNMIHLIASSVVYMRIDDAQECAYWSKLPYVDLVTALLVTGVSEGTRRILVGSIREEIVSRETKHGRNAAVALLNTVCDASVELNEKLLITADAPRLRAMLLHGSVRSLIGVEFAKFIPAAADRETFVKHARSRDSLLNQEKELADYFHIRIRDSAHNDLEVEIFMVSFQSFDRTKLLVGIREKPVDAEVLPRDLPIEVSFDASSFEVVSQSSEFDLRSPAKSCQVGECLRTWMVRCEQNQMFVREIQMGIDAVRFSQKEFSFDSIVVLQDLVKPGTAYVPGHRFLAACSMSLAIKDVMSTDFKQSTCGVAAIEVEASISSSCSGEATKTMEQRPTDGKPTCLGVASADLVAANAPSQRRVIASMKVNKIKRIRTGRGKLEEERQGTRSRESGSHIARGDRGGRPLSRQQNETNHCPLNL